MADTKWTPKVGDIVWEAIISAGSLLFDNNIDLWRSRLPDLKVDGYLRRLVVLGRDGDLWVIVADNQEVSPYDDEDDGEIRPFNPLEHYPTPLAAIRTSADIHRRFADRLDAMAAELESKAPKETP